MDNRARLLAVLGFISSLCVFLAEPKPAHAGSYEYHDRSALSLGRGFDPKNPFYVYATKCIDSKGQENIDNKGGTAGVKIHTQIIKSQEQFYNETGFSAKLDAHYQFFSGGASFSDSKVFSSSQDSLTWIVKAELIFGRYRLVDPDLSDKAKEIKANAAEFTQRCGAEFGAQETRGARAMIIFNARNLSTENKKKMEVSIYASLNTSTTDVKLNLDYRETIREVRKTAIIDQKFVTFGGPGGEVLRSMVQDVDDPIKLKAGLADYMVRITNDNAAPLHWETGSYAQFGAVVLGEMMANRDNIIAQMGYRYRDLQAVVERIYSFIKPDDSINSYLKVFVPQEERVRLETTLDKYSERSTALYKQAQACLKDEKDCVVLKITDLPYVEFPKIPGVPEARLAFECSEAFKIPQTPSDTAIVGQAAVIIAFPGNVDVKEATIEYFNEKVSPAIFDLFQTDNFTQSELAFLKSMGVPDDNKLRWMARILQWAPGICRPATDVDLQQNWRQFAKLRFSARRKNQPIKLRIVDVFDRVRQQELVWWKF